MERTYDYPAKNAARAAWMRFLPEFDHPDGTVGLYLAGPENLELQGYLNKGLRPEHLITVERDAKRLSQVMQHSQGVRVVPGELRQAVSRLAKEPGISLSFANIDLEGSYVTCIDDIMSIFTIFPASEGGVIGVTSYCAHDDDTLLQGIVNTSKFYSGLPDRVTFHTGFGTILSRHDKLRLLLETRAPDHGYLTRELGFLWWMVFTMSLSEFRPKGLRSFDWKRLRTMTAPLDRITVKARSLCKQASDFHLVYEAELGPLLERRRSCLWPVEYRSIAYFTQAKQPMRSWFIRVAPITEANDRPSMREVLKQAWNLAVRAPLTYIDAQGQETRFV